jgi:membrane protease YdiL (CAAX protease family)
MKQRMIPFIYWMIIFVVWSFVRTFLNLSDFYTEVLLKPLLWLSPLFYFWYSSFPSQAKKRLQISLLHFDPLRYTVVLPILGTLLYAGVMNVSKIHHPTASVSTFLGVIGISLATAIVEEIVFRGILLNWLENLYPQMQAFLITQMLFLLIHTAVLFQQIATPIALIIHILMIIIMGAAYTLIYRQTKSLPASSLSHTTWNAMNVLFSSIT